MSNVVLTGLAAVYAAAGISMDAKDSVPREVLSSAINAAMAEGEKAGLLKAGNDSVKIAADATVSAYARAKTILDHAEAKGREGMARHLAFDTDMSADAAAAMLKAAPKGAQQARLQGHVPDPQLSADDQSVSHQDASAAWDLAMSKRGMNLPK